MKQEQNNDNNNPGQHLERHPQNLKKKASQWRLATANPSSKQSTSLPTNPGHSSFINKNSECSRHVQPLLHCWRVTHSGWKGISDNLNLTRALLDPCSTGGGRLLKHGGEGRGTRLLVHFHKDPLLCQHIMNHLDNWLSIFYFGPPMMTGTPNSHWTMHTRFLHKWIGFMSLGWWIVLLHF
jgi:hypothetical protein